MTDEQITYQLAIGGRTDVILRPQPSGTIADSMRQAKGSLELIEDHVGVRVYEKDATGQSRERQPTDDETTELGAALERLLGHEVTVQPYEAS